MKHHPERRELAHYPTRFTLPTRYADMDLWQHLNNASLIGLHGEALQRWLCEALGTEAWRPAAEGPVLALQHSATDFVAESHYPAALEAGVRPVALDAQGLVLASALFQHGRCVGLHEARFTGWLHGVPAGLPAAVHAALAASPAAPPTAVPAASPTAPSAAATDDASDPATPPTPAQMAWHTPLATRFGDTDARGQASDASLARFAEQLRVSFLTERLGALRHHGDIGFMVGRVALRWWRRSGRPPATWQAGSRVTRVGERSIGLQGALFDEGGTCHASAESVLVCIDRASRRSTPLPEALRAVL